VLVFDAASNLVQDSYFLDSNGIFGALTAVAGSTLTSTILVADQNGNVQWIKTTTSFDATVAISPGVEPVTSGSVVFGDLVIQNIQEESSYVVATQTAP
jgi:hypothetical protein